MEEHGVEKVSLDELFSRSDFVSIHVPLSEKTRHSIGERQLRLMKPKAVLINTARGEIVDQQALVRALTEGWIAARRPRRAGSGAACRRTTRSSASKTWCSRRTSPAIPIVSVKASGDTPSRRWWRCRRTGMPIWIVNPEVVPWWQCAESTAIDVPLTRSRPERQPTD